MSYRSASGLVPYRRVFVCPPRVISPSSDCPELTVQVASPNWTPIEWQSLLGRQEKAPWSRQTVLRCSTNAPPASRPALATSAFRPALTP